MELRVLNSSLSSSNDGALVVEGLVNKTESWSHILGNRKKFREKVEKGVFQRAIDKAGRIDFLSEHKPDLLLATTENDSLELWEDEEGLKMKARIAPTSYGKDAYTLMAEQLLSHMSFGFKVVKDKWIKGIDGIFERIIEEIELKEVSVVRDPAYPASAIAARGIELVEDVEIPSEIEEEKRNDSGFDIESLKALIKEELLKELKTETVVEDHPVQAVADPVVETVEEKPSETETVVEVVEEKPIEEKPIEVVAEPVAEESVVVAEESSAKVEDLEPSAEVKTETDHYATAFDLIKKYREIQNLK